MKQVNERDAELLSALADGRLEGETFARAVVLATDTPQGRVTWHAYHVVGDALRSAELADCGGDMDFLLRLRGRLAAEPAPAPAAQPEAPVRIATAPAGAPVQPEQVAANTRWKLVAGLASVAAMAAWGWQWMAPALGPLPAAQVAQAAKTLPQAPAALAAAAPSTAPALAQAATSAVPPVMLRDPRLDELLAAHRQFGGTSALQMPAGFLRNATFERPER